MYKIFVSMVLLCASSVQSTNTFGAAFLLARADIGSIAYTLSDGSNQAAPMPNWSQLSEDQRKVLAPLGVEWDTLRPWQKEKMLDIAKDYPKMDAQKQQRVQKRLNSWSRMTPYERENARTRYQKFHSLSADKQEVLRKKWSEYEKLPQADRDKLRQSNEYDPELE